MTLFLAATVDDTTTEFPITGTVPDSIGNGYRFQLSGSAEVMELIRFGARHYSVGESRAAGVLDKSRWFVRRRVLGTTATIHLGDARVEAVVDAYVASEDETAPDPIPEVGSGTPTLAEVLAEGADADGVTMTNLGAPSNPNDAARLADITGGASSLDLGAAGSDYFYFVPSSTYNVFYGLTQNNGNACTGIAGGPNGESPTDGLRATIINGPGALLYLDPDNEAFAYPNGDHGASPGTDPTFGFDWSNLPNPASYVIMRPNTSISLIYNGALTRWQIDLGTFRAATTVTFRQFEYDVALDGGATGGFSLRDIDGLGLIAGNWVIQNAELDVIVPFDSAGSATVEIKYVADDIVAATAFDAEPWASEGLKATLIQLGTITTHLNLATDDIPTIVIAGADLTAGKFRLALTGWQTGNS